MYHYDKQLRLNLGKKGLINKEFDHINLLKELSTLPFIINNNKNDIDEIFDVYIAKYQENTYIIELLKAFISYYNSTWKIFLYNGLLNYYNLNKIQRTNCYLENYNKRIKEKLEPYLGYIGFSFVPRPVFISFIIFEENYFKEYLINEDTSLKSKPNTNIEFIDTNSSSFNNKKDETNVLYFLKYKEFSCRYESYFFYKVMYLIVYLKKIIVF